MNKLNNIKHNTLIYLVIAFCYRLWRYLVTLPPTLGFFFILEEEESIMSMSRDGPGQGQVGPTLRASKILGSALSMRVREFDFLVDEINQILIIVRVYNIFTYLGSSTASLNF